MAGEPDEVKAEVARQFRPAEFVQRLGERIGAQLTAAAVFGDPIEREGVTVIPVAFLTSRAQC